VRINVSGQTFETMRRTLEKYPDTLLGSDERDYFYDSVAGEYFFDRDPSLFRYVLAYYRSVYHLNHFEDRYGDAHQSNHIHVEGAIRPVMQIIAD